MKDVEDRSGIYGYSRTIFFSQNMVSAVCTVHPSSKKHGRPSSRTSVSLPCVRSHMMKQQPNRVVMENTRVSASQRQSQRDISRTVFAAACSASTSDTGTLPIEANMDNSEISSSAASAISSGPPPRAVMQAS